MDDSSSLLLQATPGSHVSVRSITDRDVRLLRRSLIGFGLLAFLAPFALAIPSGYYLDFIALYILVIGATLTRRSPATFPWAAVWSLIYPLAFVWGCFTPDVFDYRYWLMSNRYSGAPVLFHLVQAVWACVNIALMVRFYRIQKLGGRGGPLWQYRLRSLLAWTTLLAVLLGLGSWYYRQSVPPNWATADALEQRYSSQLRALAKYAYDHGTDAVLQDQEHLRKLLTSEEIVAAYVSTTPPIGGEVRLVMKPEDATRSGSDRTRRWHRNPRIGHPVASLWGDRFVEYEALVIDKKGVERGYSLVVDLSKMKGGSAK